MSARRPIGGITLKYEIKIRLTHTHTYEAETPQLAEAYAKGRVAQSEAHDAVLHSIIQIDPPRVDAPCPGCEYKHRPAVTLALPAPTSRR